MGSALQSTHTDFTMRKWEHCRTRRRGFLASGAREDEGDYHRTKWEYKNCTQLLGRARARQAESDSMHWKGEIRTNRMGKRHLSKSTINSIDRLWIDWWVNKENHSKRKVLSLPSIDSSPPLQKEERAAASGQRGAGISVAGCGAHTRTTTKGQCDGEDDISFHHQTYINTIQPAK